jgi:hypothetical protein
MKIKHKVWIGKTQEVLKRETKKMKDSTQTETNKQETGKWTKMKILRKSTMNMRKHKAIMKLKKKNHLSKVISKISSQFQMNLWIMW